MSLPLPSPPHPTPPPPPARCVSYLSVDFLPGPLEHQLQEQRPLATFMPLQVPGARQALRRHLGEEMLARSRQEMLVMGKGAWGLPGRCSSCGGRVKGVLEPQSPSKKQEAGSQHLPPGFPGPRDWRPAGAQGHGYPRPRVHAQHHGPMGPSLSAVLAASRISGRRSFRVVPPGTCRSSTISDSRSQSSVAPPYLSSSVAS